MLNAQTRAHVARTAAIWWTGGPDYNRRMDYFASRGLLRVFRLMISSCSLLLTAISALLLLVPGPEAGVWIRLASIVISVFWAVRWQLDPLPSVRTATLFAFTSVIAVVAVSVADEDVMAGAFGLAGLGLISTFAAFMLSSRMFIAISALAAVSVAGFFWLLLAEYGLVMALIKSALLLACTIGVPAAVQVGLAFLSHDATTSDFDPLTGTLNRRGLLNESASRLTRARTPRERTVALLLVDLDGFKYVNDVYGHAAGDTTLVRVGDVLRSVVVPVGGTVARIGGDEFAVLVTGRDEAECLELAEAIRRAVAAGVADVTASVGISTGPIGGDDPARQAVKRMLAQADAAMYRAKETGDAVIAHAGA